MKNKRVKKACIFGAAALLISMVTIPLVNSDIFKPTDQNYCRPNTKTTGESRLRGDIIVPDDYPTIQEAIDHASDGDRIIVRAGTYTENIIVDKMLRIEGEGLDVAIIDGGGADNTVEVASDGVSISGFTIQNSGSSSAGIYVSKYHYNSYIMNLITNNGHGIQMDASNGNQIMDNVIINNNGEGLWLESSHMNKISGNNISGNNKNGLIVNFTSTFNNITSNIANANNVNGAVVNAASRSNTVMGNMFSENQIGVKGLGASDNNLFHHNDFKENVFQNANDSSNDIWNSIDEGNWWSDFDEPSEGAYDNDSNGIVDTPYDIPGGENQDGLPLVGPTTPNIPTITGPDKIKVGERAEFKVYTPDPNYGKVYYQIYWGRGFRWEASVEVDSTTGATFYHTWEDELTYKLRARAFVEVHGDKVYSQGSPPRPVEVPIDSKIDISNANKVNLLEKSTSLIEKPGVKPLKTSSNVDISDKTDAVQDISTRIIDDDTNQIDNVESRRMIIDRFPLLSRIPIIRQIINLFENIRNTV